MKFLNDLNKVDTLPDLTQEIYDEMKCVELNGISMLFLLCLFAACIQQKKVENMPKCHSLSLSFSKTENINLFFSSKNLPVEPV